MPASRFAYCTQVSSPDPRCCVVVLGSLSSFWDYSKFAIDHATRDICCTGPLHVLPGIWAKK
eukprot:11665959-Heterocapsa_arctica.AAC.1